MYLAPKDAQSCISLPGSNMHSCVILSLNVRVIGLTKLPGPTQELRVCVLQYCTLGLLLLERGSNNKTFRPFFSKRDILNVGSNVLVHMTFANETVKNRERLFRHVFLCNFHNNECH